jgi:uncharacterized repeat protein (TIGR01451 family)
MTVLGTTPVSGGLAALFTIALPAGPNSLWAYYGGDATYAPSKSAAVSETVNAIAGLFQAPVSVAPYGPGFIAVGDFNGDGRADLVFSGEQITVGGFPGIFITLGNGDGTFQPPVGITGGCGWTKPIAVGDFNGDGKADLAVGNSCGGTVGIWLGNGDGTFQEASDYVTGGNPPFIAVGDFNGDGNADLIASDGCGLIGELCVGTSNSVFLGNGDGTFRAGSNYNLAGSVTVGDFNGDGKADLVADGGALLGNGDGTFQAGISFGASGTAVVGDFNGDGRDDLAVANLNGTGVSVLLGNGDGTFQTPVNYVAVPSFRSIAIGDFNGDGNTDIVTGGSLLLGNGDGTFQTALSYSSGFVATFVATGPFEGSGHTDLSASTATGVSVLLNSPPTPDLIIASTHGGNFTQGQVGSYTVTVTNIGTAATSGTVTVTDTLPSGLTATAISGSGWTCALSTVTCSRADVLAISASYPTIAVTVSVSASAATSVTNTATVSGGGETNMANDLASDPTQINISEAGQTITFAAVGTQLIGTPPFVLTATASSGLAVNYISTSTAICTVSGATVTLIAAGTCSITATQGGNLTYAVAAPVAQTFAVRYPQTITFGPLSNVALIPPFTVNATASSGLAVSFVSTTGSICTISGNTVTIVAAGTCSIAASQVGNAAYAAVTAVTQSFTVISGPGYLLTTAVSPANSGSVSPASAGNYYAFGSVICLTASPAAGQIFTGWSGAALNAAGCLTMTANASVTANFGANPISATSALRFVPVAPCRLVDTRNATGPLGGPSIGAQSARSFTIPGTCNIPSTALAYSLNLTVVPHGTLGYVTLWPIGQPQPVVSTLNSIDGRVKSNAAIVPAGTGEAVSVFATNTTDVILDINGYFDSYTDTAALQFYPLTPCRVADTRNSIGSLGGPSLQARQTRSFPIASSACNIPSNALAYSLNFTAIPKASLGYLSVWPSGQSQPGVSTLNAPTGAVTANAAIVPAGTGGAIELFVTDNSDMAIDINGYFAAPAGGGLSLYNLTPCRIEDTRLPAGTPAFTGTVTETATGVACGIPPEARALVLNATVVPSGELGFLSLWANGGSQPGVSTLNSLDSSVTSNMAVVPTTNGLVNAYAAGPGTTYLILDMSGYFAP